MAPALAATRTNAQPHPAGALLTYVWARYRRLMQAWIFLWLGLLVFDRAGFGSVRPHGLTEVFLVLILPGLLLGLPLVLFVDIDPQFFVRPVSTHMLAACHMFCGAVAIMAAWGFNAALLWIPLGFAAPMWWPASALAASLCLFQTVRWFPLAGGYLQAALFCVVPPMSVVASAFAASQGVPALTIFAANMAVAVSAYPLAVRGLGRLRRGDIPVCPWFQGFLALRALKSDLRSRRFRSPLAAQVWMEWRSHGWLVAIGIGGLALLTTPILFFPLSEQVSLITIMSGGKLSVQANMWADTLPLLSVAATLFLSAILGCIDPGLRKPDTSLNATFATRPMACLGLVTAKLVTCGVSSVATLIALLPFIALWLALPGHSGGTTAPLGVFLWRCAVRYLQPEDFSLIAGVSVYLGLLTYKLQADTLFLHLTGGKWSGWIYLTLSLFPLAPVFGILDFHDNPSHRPFIQDALRCAVPGCVVLRSVTVALTALALRRRNLISTGLIIRIVLIWTIVTVVLAALLVAGLSGVAAPASVIAAVYLAMPGTRTALAPLALHWDRHR